MTTRARGTAVIPDQSTRDSSHSRRFVVACSFHQIFRLLSHFPLPLSLTPFHIGKTFPDSILSRSDRPTDRPTPGLDGRRRSAALAAVPSRRRSVGVEVPRGTGRGRGRGEQFRPAATRARIDRRELADVIGPGRDVTVSNRRERSRSE